MKNQISNQTFDEERSLYNIKDTEVLNCKFEGPADGESVLKECRNFSVNGCSFSLRYPMWHAKNSCLRIHQWMKKQEPRYGIALTER